MEIRAEARVAIECDGVRELDDVHGVRVVLVVRVRHESSVDDEVDPSVRADGASRGGVRGVGARGRGDAHFDGEEGGVVVAEGERADGGDGGAVQAHVDEALVRAGRDGARHGGDGDAHLLRGDGSRVDARGVRRERRARGHRARHRVPRERDAARAE